MLLTNEVGSIFCANIQIGNRKEVIMLLLPNINLYIDGGHHELSIQDPYTLDGSLITRISYNQNVYGDVYPNDNIIIENLNHLAIRVNAEELCRNFEHEMNNFIYNHGDRAGTGEHNYVDFGGWNSYKIRDYLQDIRYQGDRLRRISNRSNGINRLIERMYRQRRRSNDAYNVNDCYYGFSTGLNGDDVTIGINEPSSWFTSTIDTWCNVASGSMSMGNISLDPAEKEYIHKHDYKPEYIHHYMPDEDKDTTLLLGCEIEVAGNEKEPNREEVVKKCIQIINGSEDDTEDLIYSTSDSTVQIELDTMPCSFEFHKNKMNYKELFKYLDELGYKGHDCNSAGLHIHACRSYLGKSELVQQLTISKILYILEKFNDEICVIARRNNSYSQFAGNKKDEKSVIELYTKYKDKGKHVALNLKHKDSVEFRCFKSTLKYETFMLTLEFVKNIIDYAKSINIEEIEMIQWSDLMNTFSDELKEYYNNRLKKEQEKKADKVEKANTNFSYADRIGRIATGVTYDDHYGIYSGVSNLVLDSISNMTLEPTTTTTTTLNRDNLNTLNTLIDNVRAVNNNTNNSIYYNDGFSGSLSTNYSLSYDDYMRLCGITPVNPLSVAYVNTSSMSIESQNKDTVIDKLKNDIKNLKKKIKNSNNYLEKSRLEAELNIAQKELKKEKKKSKLNNNTNTVAV